MQLRVFHASWRSGFGAAALICAAFVMVFLCMSFDEAVPHGLPVACLLLFGAGFVLMAVQVAGRPAVISVGLQGIGGRGLRGHVIPWHEMAHIHHERAGGTDRLVLTLIAGAPSLAVTRRLLNARSRKRAVLLGALRRSDMRQAVALVLDLPHAHP